MLMTDCIRGRGFVACILLLGSLATPAAAVERVAFFGVHLINASMEPVSEAEEARRQAMEARIRAALTDSGRYEFVDIAPVAGQANLFENLAQCNGCDARMAEELGADLALSAEIQKTSNLILHITIYLREAGSGALVGGGSADIRGNNDQSWERGTNYVLRNRILKP